MTKKLMVIILSLFLVIFFAALTIAQEVKETKATIVSVDPDGKIIKVTSKADGDLELKYSSKRTKINIGGGTLADLKPDTKVLVKYVKTADGSLEARDISSR